MTVHEILDTDDYQIIKRRSNELELLDELLVNHYMKLDVHDYALLRITQNLSLIAGSLSRLEDNIG